MGEGLSFSINAIDQASDKIQAIVGRVDALISRVVQLSTEQARLEATQTRLGLSMGQAQQATSQYVSRVELADVASRAAAAGIALNQRELEALTRVAGNYAATTGEDMTQALQRLTQGLVSGEREGLRPFGAALSRLAGDSHTAKERVAALVDVARTVGPTAETAASSWARFKGELEESARVAAGGLTQGWMEASRAGDRASESARRAAEGFSLAAAAMSAMGLESSTSDVARFTGQLTQTVTTLGRLVATLATASFRLDMPRAFGQAYEQATALVGSVRSLIGLENTAADGARRTANATREAKDEARGLGGATTNAATGMSEMAKEAEKAAAIIRQMKRDMGFISEAARNPNLEEKIRRFQAAQRRRARGGGGRRERRADMVFSEEEIASAQSEDTSRIEGLMARATIGAGAPATLEDMFADEDVGKPADTMRGEQQARLAIQETLVGRQIALIEQAQAAAREGRDLSREEAEALSTRNTLLQQAMALQAGYREELGRIDAELAQARTAEQYNAILQRRISVMDRLARSQQQVAAITRREGMSFAAFGEKAKEVLGQMNDAFASSVVAVVSGAKSFEDAMEDMARSVLQSILKTAIVEGLKELAMMAASLAIQNYPAAAQHGISAGLWAAVGVAAGAGVAVMGTGEVTEAKKEVKGVEGGGGAPTERSEPARLSAAGTGGGEGPVVLNFNISGALFNEGVEDAVVRAVDGAANRGVLPRAMRRLGARGR